MRKIDIGGAITILNAIATNIGSTIGTVPIHNVELKQSDVLSIDTGDENIGPELVEACIELIHELYEINNFPIEIKIRAGYPPSRGMKTSSAISLAVMYLLSQEFDLKLTDRQIVEMSAKASINCGVSITGAIDDAYACWYGGYWVTENSELKILMRKEIDMQATSVLFLVPRSYTPKSSIQLRLNQQELGTLEDAKAHALQGNWMEAIKLNTLIYSNHLLDDPSIIQKIEEVTQGVVGLNGAGPALFVILKNNSVEDTKKRIVEKFPKYTIFVSELR